MKRDADQIRTVLDNLSRMDWIKRTERRWWPRFLFHYTDIQNAARILSLGHLHSRQYLVDEQLLAVSSGSEEVLAGTHSDVKNSVRLYFRPKTPTQYYAEGVKSSHTLSNSRFPDAHCPVPVFFLFDAAEVLSREDSWFSDRGLASRNYQIMSTAQDLANLDWRKIYHTGSIDIRRPEESDIISRRMAEVIIPDRLDLESLKWIYCRSEAEKDTLLHLLTDALRPLYETKIVATTRSDLYFRQHTYLESVRMESKAAYLSFSPDTQSPGPFRFQVIIRSNNDTRRNAKEDVFLQKGKFRGKINTGFNEYELEIRLDRHMVYRNRYIEVDDIPF